MSGASQQQGVRGLRLLLLAAAFSWFSQAVASDDWPLSVVIIDESGSMKNRNSAQWLHQNLPATASSAQIMYGVVAFSEKARVIDSGAGTLWPADGLEAGFGVLELTSGVEDGLSAVDFALDEFGVFPDAAMQLLLVSDEDRDVVDSRVDNNTLGVKLAASGVTLDAIVSVSIRCGGRPAMGLSYTGTAYVADGQGGYRACAGGMVQNLADSPVRDYVLLALGSGGTVWDIGITGWHVRGQTYPEATSPKRASARAAFKAVADGYWKRQLDQSLTATARVSPLLANVGSVLELNGAASRSLADGRSIAQFEWLVDGVVQTAGEKAVAVAATPGLMQITLRVTDNGFPPRVSEDTVAVWVSE